MFSSFSSFPSFSSPFSLFRSLSKYSTQAIKIDSVEIHDIETRHEKRARTLKHLLKLNHVNHSITHHHREFHNHMPHILGSAYLLGADSEHLNVVYEAEAKGLEKWEDSPGEISKYDWREFLGDRKYARAYVDFFEDELVLNGYEWRKVLNDFLFEGKEPLINCLVSGLGHPLIHLGYAYEISSREVAMEALGLATTFYDSFHKYLDDPSYTRTPTYSCSSLLEILARVRDDKRLDSLSDHKGGNNLGTLFKDHEDTLVDHWNAWHISDPVKQFEDSQMTAAALLVATTTKDDRDYDFFILHLLTTSHAVRILLPLIPDKYHIPLARQWWLFSLAVYIAQLRPRIEVDIVLDYDLQKRDWKSIEKKAIEGKWATDAHYVKGIRALKEAANTWGDENQFYLKSAAKFADEFEGWGGFE